MFRVALSNGARNGEINQQLYDVILDLSRHWLPNTRLIEGVNSIIKRICERSPHIGWQLLSSRITVKMFIAFLKQVHGVEHAPLSVYADAFLRECEVEHRISEWASLATERFVVPAADQYPGSEAITYN